MKVQLLTTLFLAFVALPPALAQLQGSDCGDPGKDLSPAQPYPKLQPWFLDASTRIEKAFKLEERAPDIRMVRCVFEVSQDGSLSNISYFCRAKSKDQNECAMRIIKSASPLAPPPGDLQWTKKVVVQFSNSTIQLWMAIPPSALPISEAK